MLTRANRVLSSHAWRCPRSRIPGCRQRGPGRAAIGFLALLVLTALPAAAASPEGGLTLEAALRQAEEYSWSLQRADAEVSEAAAGTAAARARRLPQLGSRVSATYMTNPPEGVKIQRGDLGTTESPGTTFPVPVPDQDVVLVPDGESMYYQLNLTLEQPLFTWGKLARGEQAAQLQHTAAETRRTASRRELRRDTETAYYGVRFAARALELLQEAEEISTRIASDRELAFEVGTVNRESLLESRAELQELRMQRRRNEQALRSAEAGLSNLLGRDIRGEDLVSDYQRQQRERETEAELIERARALSPDLQELELQRQQAEIAAEVERRSGVWRPDIALQLQLETSGQRVPPQANWYDSWDSGLRISLAGSLDIYDGGSSRAAVEQAESRLRQAEAGAAELHDGLEYQVRTAVERVSQRRSQLELAELRFELAGERAKNARVSFENELITRREERGARILELMARLEAERARFELETGLAELAFLTSGS